MAKRIKPAETGSSSKASKAGKSIKKIIAPAGKSNSGTAEKQNTESVARSATAAKSKVQSKAGASKQKNAVKPKEVIAISGNKSKKAAASKSSTGKGLGKAANTTVSGKTTSKNSSDKSSEKTQRTGPSAQKRKPATKVSKQNNRTGKAAGSDSISARKKAVPLPTEKLRTVTPSGKNDQTFFELVFEVARQIPKGRVTSYGAIAASLGARSSSRLVGWAMNLAGGAKPKVPAHRVVNRNGMLSGKHHFATPTQMQELLEREGVKVKNDKVVDFNRLFWDPMDLGE